MSSQTRPKSILKSHRPPSIDWNRFTNFRSRNTRKDLERLLQGTSRSRARTKELLEQPDRTGLYPIHWAAINNRSDMIEVLYEAGSPLAKPCHNRLLANGTPLHLAAMNGSLEAAAMLLAKSHEMEAHRTRPKSLSSADAGRQIEEDQEEDEKQENNASSKDEEDHEPSRLLGARDTEGQTPLMRAAAPRSKRMDAIRDLLRKNFWSLSGRPGEMALFLICMGADWRATEPRSGMNLLHLAVANDYDDIVSLLLVLDKSLLGTPTLPKSDRARSTTTKRSSPPKREKDKKPLESTRPKTSPADDFENVSLRTETSTDTTTTPTGSETTSLELTTDDYDGASEDETASETSSAPTTPRRPLLESSNRERAQELVAAGLTPLQLAILYGRVAVISQLWYTSKQLPPPPPPPQQPQDGATKHQPKDSRIQTSSQVEVQQAAIRSDKQSAGARELKRLLVRACMGNKQELAKMLKPALLKGALVLDLTLLALLWAPTYATSLSELAGGLFIVSFVLTMALTLRTMLKNPGYLRRNSVQYLSELAKLLEGRVTGKCDLLREQRTVEKSHRTQDANSDQQGRRAPARSPLIKLEPSDNLAINGAQNSKAQQPTNSATDEKKQDKKSMQETKSRKVTTTTSVGVLQDERVSVNAFRALQDKVRLFCHKCQCVRRPRSRHCQSCNHCVQDFDHHCIYLGACIGRHNRLDFLLAMVALAITGLYGSLLHLSGGGGGASHHTTTFHLVVGFLWVFKYALIGALAAFLGARRACLGVTLYEEVRSKRIRRTFGRSGPPADIAKSHRAYSTELKGAFWRYAPDRFLRGDLSARQVLANLREFSNYLAPEEYLLTFLCTDTPLARSLTTSDSRMKQLYKFV